MVEKLSVEGLRKNLGQVKMAVKGESEEGRERK